MISVVIVNYNSGQLLGECISSLLKSDFELELIVVDNSSSDGSVESLENLHNLTIIRNDENLGFSAACNIGLNISSSNVLFFLNPDCFIHSGALSALMLELESGNRVGMVGGLLLNEDGSEQGGGRRAIPTPWRSFVRAFGLHLLAARWPKLFFDFHLSKQPLPKEPIEVEAISGACMLVKREAIQDVGLWDEGYFLHCEDLDWCMRFREKGWKILFVPSAKVTHALGACSRKRPVFVEWHKHKGMIRFYNKFFKHQYPMGLMWLVSVGVWFRFCLVSVIRLLDVVKTRLAKIAPFSHT